MTATTPLRKMNLLESVCLGLRKVGYFRLLLKSIRLTFTMTHSSIPNSPLSEVKQQLLSDSGFSSPDLYSRTTIENQSLEYIDLHCFETLDFSQDSQNHALSDFTSDASELDLEDPLGLVNWENELPVQLRPRLSRTPPGSPQLSQYSHWSDDQSQEVPDSGDSDVESLPDSQGTYEDSDIEYARDLDSCNDAVVPNVCLEE